MCIWITFNFNFFTWGIFFISPYSAENINGGLVYWVGNELFSTRYVIGTLFITELLFAYFLWKLKTPRVAIFTFFGISILSRSIIIFEGISKQIDFSLIIFPYIVLVCLILLHKFRNKLKQKTVFLIILGSVILILSPIVVETNRVNWVPDWYDVVSHIYNLPPSQIFLIKQDMNNSEFWDKTYPIYGESFQHQVTVDTKSNLLDIIKSENNTPEYIVILCKPNVECKSPLFKLKNELRDVGYTVVVTDKNAMLLNKTN